MINKTSFQYILYYIAAAIGTIAILASVIYYFNKDNDVSISQNEKEEMSVTQIKSIEAIGEWEFLTINCEEMVDTLNHGFFGDNELICIYYGTLRMGINMHEAGPKWITTQGDSIHVLLPAVKLLDNNFIDEVRTKTFFQKGKWDDKTREALYHKAYKKMKARALTPQNIATTQSNAQEQFQRLMQAMGYNKVKIEFARPYFNKEQRIKLH